MDDFLGAGKVTKEGLELVKEPVRTLLGEAWGELGGILTDKVKNARQHRQLALAMKTIVKLRELGISPQSVHPSLLYPILESGSLVDDERLSDKWVNLLARAASDDAGLVHPSYIQILSQLSPLEARILDWTFGRRPGYPLPIHMFVLEEEFKAERGVLQVAGGNLLRLGLWSNPAPEIPRRIFERVFEIQEQREQAQTNPILRPSFQDVDLSGKRDEFHYTVLGVEFMRACQAPPKPIGPVDM